MFQDFLEVVVKALTGLTDQEEMLMAIDMMLWMPLILHGGKHGVPVQQGGITKGKDRNGRQPLPARGAAGCFANASSLRLLLRCLGDCTANADQSAHQEAYLYCTACVLTHIALR